MEVEFDSCVECNDFNDRVRKIRKTIPDFILQPSGKNLSNFSCPIVEVITMDTRLKLYFQFNSIQSAVPCVNYILKMF